MPRIASLFALLASLWLLGAPAAQASVVLQYDFDQLVAEADAIVYGRVVDQQASWQDHTIITRVVLEVVSCPKGAYAPGEQVVVEQAGGVVGDLAMVVPGEATFATGEEVVVFLEVSPEAGAPLVLGMSQGKFTIIADPEGTLMVTRSLEGLALVSPEGALLEPALERPLMEITDGVFLTSANIRLQVQEGPVVVPLTAFLSEIERTLTNPETY